MTSLPRRTSTRLPARLRVASWSPRVAATSPPVSQDPVIRCPTWRSSSMSPAACANAGHDPLQPHRLRPPPPPRSRPPRRLRSRLRRNPRPRLRPRPRQTTGGPSAMTRSHRPTYRSSWPSTSPSEWPLGRPGVSAPGKRSTEWVPCCSPLPGLPSADSSGRCSVWASRQSAWPRENGGRAAGRTPDPLVPASPIRRYGRPRPVHGRPAGSPAHSPVSTAGHRTLHRLRHVHNRRYQHGRRRRPPLNRGRPGPGATDPGRFLSAGRGQ